MNAYGIWSLKVERPAFCLEKRETSCTKEQNLPIIILKHCTCCSKTQPWWLQSDELHLYLVYNWVSQATACHVTFESTDKETNILVTNYCKYILSVFFLNTYFFLQLFPLLSFKYLYVKTTAQMGAVIEKSCQFWNGFHLQNNYSLVGI